MMSQKITDLKEKLNTAAPSELPELIREWGLNEREGVRKLAQAAERRYQKYEKELIRLEEMSFYEKKYQHLTYLCGIDEVGRGPLAGPVMTAAVILPNDARILYLNDSKQLSEEKREAIYPEIMEKAIAVGFGLVTAQQIDEINILQATYEAMRCAVRNLSVTPKLLLVDAVTIPEIDIPQVSIIKGDAKSISIAAASVVAKVTRDRLMKQYDLLYPEYGFASNKGYGSKMHMEALQKYGPCPIHRKSFLGGLTEGTEKG